jgi:hypothetical protein
MLTRRHHTSKLRTNVSGRAYADVGISMIKPAFALCRPVGGCPAQQGAHRDGCQDGLDHLRLAAYARTSAKVINATGLSVPKQGSQESSTGNGSSRRGYLGRSLNRAISAASRRGRYRILKRTAQLQPEQQRANP